MRFCGFSVQGICQQKGIRQCSAIAGQGLGYLSDGIFIVWLKKVSSVRTKELMLMQNSFHSRQHAKSNFGTLAGPLSKFAKVQPFESVQSKVT